MRKTIALAILLASVASACTTAPYDDMRVSSRDERIRLVGYNQRLEVTA